MKKLNIKYLIATALFAVFVAGCKDDDFENYRIQSVDNHGIDQPIISTAVTSTSNEEFAVVAVDPTTDEKEYALIPVVLNSAKLAPQDIHVKMVWAPDSLDSYNAANDTEYDLAGNDGTPPFTLLDDGVVTIPKGSSTGYLKIKATSFNYYGSNAAFPFRIESVQEPGYTISANHNFGIAVLIAKNQYDGKYALNITTSGWQDFGISNDMPGDYGTVEFWTTGKNSNTFNLTGFGLAEPAFTAGNASKTAFGATKPIFTFDDNNKLIGVDNGVPDDGRGRDFYINPDPAAKNYYDPDTQTIYGDYFMVQNGRPAQHIVIKMTYKGPR